jgi:hypothetical protein
MLKPHSVPHETALGADKNIKLLGYELLAKRTEKDQPRKLEIKNWEIDKPNCAAASAW